ncbi:MAG TPA: hypothetical protein VN026_11470 [Bacteroidia bacterium]|jgi:hypothetical protein|nr:hypothetical protein [Bacteroidia bacterium]
MEYSYKKSEDGNHVYRIGEKILHVFHIKHDKTIVKEYERLTTTIDFKKDDCCINIVSEIREDRTDCSKEEFEDKLKEVIFILGIYEYCK